MPELEAPSVDFAQANLILPEMGLPTFPGVFAGSASPAVSAGGGGGYDAHRPKTPPPDLPSLLLDSRIVYLGMPVCNLYLNRLSTKRR